MTTTERHHKGHVCVVDGPDLRLTYCDDRWPCLVLSESRRADEAERERDKQAELSAEALMRLGQWQSIAEHMAVCECPERPRCRPHRDDGVHQWADLCDLPHDHGEPLDSREALARYHSRTSPTTDDAQEAERA